MTEVLAFLPETSPLPKTAPNKSSLEQIKGFLLWDFIPPTPMTSPSPAPFSLMPLPSPSSKALLRGDAEHRIPKCPRSLTVTHLAARFPPLCTPLGCMSSPDSVPT